MSKQIISFTDNETIELPRGEHSFDDLALILQTKIRDIHDSYSYLVLVILD